MLYYILMDEEEKKSKKKKIVIILVVLGILGILGGLGWYFRDRIFPGKGKKTVNPLGVQDQKEEFNFKWKLWEDPAGFSFEYPDEIEIDIHVEDEANYSFLTLSSKERKGKLDIICNDSQYADIDEWLSEDSLVKQGSGLETQVASVSGQRVALGNGREITAFIDWDKVIYTIDKTPFDSAQDKPEEEVDYWDQIYTHILSSFKLIPLEGETEAQFSEWLGGFDTSGMDVVESVEIIE